MKYATDHAFRTALEARVKQGQSDSAGVSRLRKRIVFERLLADEETDLPAGGQRWRVTTTLAGRIFERAVIDIAFAAAPVHAPEQITTSNLLEFAGIDGVEVPTLGIEQHLAEKLHAYTRQYAGQRRITRVKDLVDVVVIANTSAIDATKLAEAITVIFERRAEHRVPASLPEPPGVDGPVAATRPGRPRHRRHRREVPRCGRALAPGPRCDRRCRRALPAVAVLARRLGIEHPSPRSGRLAGKGGRHGGASSLVRRADPVRVPAVGPCYEPADRGDRRQRTTRRCQSRRACGLVSLARARDLLSADVGLATVAGGRARRRNGTHLYRRRGHAGAVSPVFRAPAATPTRLCASGALGRSSCRRACSRHDTIEDQAHSSCSDA